MLKKICSIDHKVVQIFDETQKKNLTKMTKTLKNIEDIEKGNYQSNGKPILNIHDRERLKKNISIFKMNISKKKYTTRKFFKQWLKVVQIDKQKRLDFNYQKQRIKLSRAISSSSSSSEEETKQFVKFKEENGQQKTIQILQNKNFNYIKFEE